MARRGRPAGDIVLSVDERETLERWTRRHSSSQALALRCRIVLACAAGSTNKSVGASLGVHPTTVSKWRLGFAADRLDGLVDAPRPGAAPTVGGHGGGGARPARLATTASRRSWWTRWKPRRPTPRIGRRGAWPRSMGSLTPPWGR